MDEKLNQGENELNTEQPAEPPAQHTPLMPPTPPEKVYVLDEQVMRTVKVVLENKESNRLNWIWPAIDRIIQLLLFLATIYGVYVAFGALEEQKKSLQEQVNQLNEDRYQFSETQQKERERNLEQAKIDAANLDVANEQVKALRSQVNALNSAVNRMEAASKPVISFANTGFQLDDKTGLYFFKVGIQNNGSRAAYLKKFAIYFIDSNFKVDNAHESYEPNALITKDLPFTFAFEKMITQGGEYHSPFSLEEIKNIGDCYFAFFPTYFDPLLNMDIPDRNNIKILKWKSLKDKQIVYYQDPTTKQTQLPLYVCTEEERSSIRKALSNIKDSPYNEFK